jgi:hypothetical protein
VVLAVLGGGVVWGCCGLGGVVLLLL